MRITPFHTHKLWSDDLGYSYSTGTNTLASLPLFLTSLENVNYRNYVYTIETGSTNQVLRKIDITDDYTVLASSNISGMSRGIQAIEVPPIGPADVIILGGIGTNNDIVINYVSGSDLSTIASNRIDSTDNPQTLYQIVTGWDDVSSSVTASTFACTDTGLYSREININTFQPIKGWQQHNDFSVAGVYYAATPLIHGGYATPYILSVAIFAAQPGVVTLAIHEMITPSVFVDSVPYGGQSDPTVKRFLLIYTNNTSVLWTLFNDGNLWASNDKGGNMRLVATNIADIQTDYDLVYNPNYAPGQAPEYAIYSRKLYVVGQNGIVFANATYNNNKLVYEEAIDCRQYVGPQNTITKTFITKNTDVPILGMYVNGGVQQSTLFTMNTKTYELSDPTFVGTLKDNVIFEADNKTDGVYAMRSYNGTTQYSTPDGASLLFEHWYKFTI